MTKDELHDWFINLSQYKKLVDAIGAYNPELDYAGPENNKTLSRFIPHTVYGIDCNMAFYQHDAHYLIGGTKRDRFNRDGDMLITALFIVEHWPEPWYLYGSNWARKHLARVRLIKYFEAVRAGGKSSFNFEVSDSDTV